MSENLFMRQFLLFIALLCHPVFAGAANPVVMLGPATHHTATILVHGNAPASVALELEPPDSNQPAMRTSPFTLGNETGYTARFDLDSLISGTTYTYRLVWNNVLQDSAYSFTTLPRRELRGFKVYVGSCAFLYDPDTDLSKTWAANGEIFDTIANEASFDSQSHLMLWLGDNLYFRTDDHEHPAGMANRYQKVRSHAALQKIFSALPHYAIWDDHDYGPNDSNQSFVFKQASLDLFKRYWPNPSAGLPDTPGIFTQFSMEDADFFLLDNRWHRDHDMDKSENKAMFGSGQLRWLKNALLGSRARFKFIAGGSQFLNDNSPFEGWHNFKNERGEFLDWLQLNNISGVIFLSGDRHHTELLRLDRADAYPLYELTCSPLTSGTHHLQEPEASNPMRVHGTLVEAHNYCTITVDGQNKDRTLILKSMDAQGKPLWETRIESAALK